MRDFKRVYDFGILFVIMAFIISGCTNTRTRSSFILPNEGGFYRYGNFCGENHPSFLADGEIEKYARLVKLLEQKPKDHLDQACQFHDFCYVLGRDGKQVCDDLFVGLIPVQGWSGQYSEACQNVVREIRRAFRYVKKYRDGSRETEDVFSFVILPIGIVSSLVGAVRSFDDGFDARPGECFLSDESINSVYLDLTYNLMRDGLINVICDASLIHDCLLRNKVIFQEKFPMSEYFTSNLYYLLR